MEKQEILRNIRKENFAIPQININELTWIEPVLKAAETMNSPVILGTSDSLITALGGYKFICNTIKNKMIAMDIKVPVIIHLDHSTSIENCQYAIDAGYDSVMYDGSKLSIDKNVAYTKQVVDYAHKNGVLVEGEVGAVGGSEDGISDSVKYASLDDCIQLVTQTNLDSLAPALGSVHGEYKGEPDLGFEEMKEIDKKLNIPLVLHGASGISNEDLMKAIKLGHVKINFNTEVKIAWAKQLRETLDNNKQLYDPQKIIVPSKIAIENIVKELINKCNSFNRV
ncbi:class II fructose-bisphosphate aldolase [Staphylococcus saprophyticus]|uniref:class II fructose-bisphosphate aldolase n=1 Tax=Staphylococcus saprophyticus TaxID=29385 RepID=UPI000D1E1112|nr:ketose-bisphosphate aldolase [Staphylococcus saprophyticus]PTK12238.1 6-phospho-5-dehydro-2-deoxy-D-gluconate aldolase [Staphylococcus saprophyticus]